MNFAIDASKILSDLGVNVEIWSVTSFNELYRDGIEHERKNLLNGTSSKSYVKSCFEKNISTIAVSDYQRAYVNQIDNGFQALISHLELMDTEEVIQEKN